MDQNSTHTASKRPSKRIHIQPITSWISIDFAELWTFRDLFAILAMRDIKLRYKQTLLGVTWVVLQPLVASLIFAIIFGRIASLPSDGKPYLLFVYVGLLPWNLFAGGLQRAGNSLISDAKLITKVYFPRLIIPIASSTAVLLDFAVSFVVLIGLLVVYHEQATVSLNILTLPVLLLIALLICVGVSLFFSALNVYYRDFMYALPFVIQVWMYVSPLVYSGTMIPERWRILYALNPMSGVIDGFRWSLLGIGDFPWYSIGLSILIGLLLFLGGAYTFQRVESRFADVV